MSTVSEGVSRADEIRATFVEDRTTVEINISDAKIRAMADDRAETRSFILQQLEGYKIDCGPKCVPKPVEEGVWECCDGRRVPPSGKVKVQLHGNELRGAFERAFSPSQQLQRR